MKIMYRKIKIIAHQKLNLTSSFFCFLYFICLSFVASLFSVLTTLYSSLYCLLYHYLFSVSLLPRHYHHSSLAPSYFAISYHFYFALYLFFASFLYISHFRNNRTENIEILNTKWMKKRMISNKQASKKSYVIHSITEWTMKRRANGKKIEEKKTTTENQRKKLLTTRIFLLQKIYV